jgi:hypothetical protein
LYSGTQSVHCSRPTSQTTADITADGAWCTSKNLPLIMLLLLLLLLLQVRAMYDAYKSPAVTLDAKQLLAWNMIMVRQRSQRQHRLHLTILITTSLLCRQIQIKQQQSIMWAAAEQFGAKRRILTSALGAAAACWWSNAHQQVITSCSSASNCATRCKVCSCSNPLDVWLQGVHTWLIEDIFSALLEVALCCSLLLLLASVVAAGAVIPRRQGGDGGVPR